jgi:hypothetical protein
MGRGQIDWWDNALHALEVMAGEFVVATPAAADIHEYAPLSALLQRVRKAFDIEAAFVSDQHAQRDTDALQKLYGMRLLEADQPANRRCRFEAVPVVTCKGDWRGTLCCRCPAGNDTSNEDALRSVAQLIANWFDQATQPAAA